MSTTEFTFQRPHRRPVVRLANQIGKRLSRSGDTFPSLSARAILKKAQRRTGLSSFASIGIEEPLQRLIDSYRSEARLSTVGTIIIRENLVRSAANHLLVEEEFRKRPEIQSSQVKKPIVVVGLPRTGTTLLQNLLAQDPAARSLQFWELMSPAPVPDPVSAATSSKVRQAKRLVRGMQRYSPEVHLVHGTTFDSLEEDHFLFRNVFCGEMFAEMANATSYVNWLDTHDMHETYQYFRRQLQLLNYDYKRHHYVLKCWIHLNNLQPLIDVLPDVCVVRTHRDPREVLGSACSVAGIVRSMFSDHWDPNYIGQHLLERFSHRLAVEQQSRQSIDPKRILDVHFDELSTNPRKVVDTIYEHFGFEMTDQYSNKLQTWIRENPQHKHGKHHYSLEQFGLEEKTVSDRFADYCERFSIPRD